MNLDFLRKSQGRKHRKPPEPKLRACGCGNTFTVGWKHRKHCSPECQLAAKVRNRVRHNRPTHPCEGCGRKVTIRFTHCYWCRKERQEQVEQRLGEMPLSPKVCGLPIRGGRCLHAIQDGTDCYGRATLWCIVHGERQAPVIRPKWEITETGDVVSKFRRYDQAERREKEIKALKIATPVDPEVSARSQRRKSVPLHVTGRALADRIRAA